VDVTAVWVLIDKEHLASWLTRGRDWDWNVSKLLVRVEKDYCAYRFSRGEVEPEEDQLLGRKKYLGEMCKKGKRVNLSD